MNPDGVILGNTRTSLAGKDLNRIYSHENNFIFPEMISHKEFFQKTLQKYGQKFLLCIDCHGHSTKKDSFFYGPETDISDQKFLKFSVLPRLFAKNTQMFNENSCKFGIEESKKKSCRGYLSKKGIPTYTLETSMYGYSSKSQERDYCFNV